TKVVSLCASLIFGLLRKDGRDLHARRFKAAGDSSRQLPCEKLSSMAAKASSGSFVFLRVLGVCGSFSARLLWRRAEASVLEERHRRRAVRAPHVAEHSRQRLVELP